MPIKSSYNDPTIATDPPGGKHHVISEEGRQLPTERPRKKAKKPKSVSVKKVARAER